MNEHETFRKLEDLLESKGLDFPPSAQFDYWHDPAFKALFTLVVQQEEVIEFIVKSIRALHNENQNISKETKTLRNRLDNLERYESEILFLSTGVRVGPKDYLRLANGYLNRCNGFRHEAQEHQPEETVENREISSLIDNEELNHEETNDTD